MNGMPPRANEAHRPHRKRCRRYNVPGDAHYLTFSCFHRQPFLTSERACRWFIESLHGSREKHEFDIWAYVLMPEHIHLLIWPRQSTYSISDILGDLKQPVTRAALTFVRKHAPEFLARMRDAQPNGKCSHRFWQRGGGYDRNLNTPRSIIEKINYIHENPVRRELVAAPADYRWSSAGFYAGKTDVDLTPDVDSVPNMVIIGGKACPR